MLARCALAAALSASELDEALDAAGCIENGYLRARALKLLARYLDDDGVARAVALADELEWGLAAAVATGALAPRLSDSARSALLVKTIDLAAGMKDGDRIAEAIDELRDQLTPELTRRALVKVRATPSEFHPAYALARVLVAAAAALPSPGRAELVTEALTVAAELDDEQLKWILGGLSPNLDDAGWRAAVALADGIAAPLEQAFTYAALAKGATEPRRQALVGRVFSLIGNLDPSEITKHEDAIESVAAWVAPYIEDPDAKLDLLSTMGPDARGRALAAAVEHSPDELRPRLLAMVCELEEASDRAAALVALAQVDGAVAGAALRDALELPTSLLHDDQLHSAAQALTACGPAAGPEGRRDLVTSMSRRERSDALAVIHAAAPLLVADARMAADVFHAVRDVAAWWP